MTIIDRYLLRQFTQNFVVCLVSLTGIFVVFDAFTHMDDFLQYAKGIELLKVMAAYYSYQSLFVFELISPTVVLMSAMFTMAWIQRHHELTALMAAGIPRIRVVMPVLAAAAAITLLAVVNRELLIPKIKDQLAKRPSGLKGNVVEELVPQYDDATNVLICGHNLVIDKKKIEQPEFVLLHTKDPLRASTASRGKQPSRNFFRRPSHIRAAIGSRTLPSRRAWRSGHRFAWTVGLCS